MDVIITVLYLYRSCRNRGGGGGGFSSLKIKVKDEMICRQMVTHGIQRMPDDIRASLYICGRTGKAAARGKIGKIGFLKCQPDLVGAIN